MEAVADTMGRPRETVRVWQVSPKFVARSIRVCRIIAEPMAQVRTSDRCVLRVALARVCRRLRNFRAQQASWLVLPC